MDKSTLLAPRAGTASGMPEDDVEIPGKGTVRVRGLSRVEALLAVKIDDLQTRERKTLTFGMVDPALDEREAGEWMKVSPYSEIEPVVTRILELSGLVPESAKEAYKEFEADPDAEFRALPGAEAVDDGGDIAADE